jgi:hypothetical protein
MNITDETTALEIASTTGKSVAITTAGVIPPQKERVQK